MDLIFEKNVYYWAYKYVCVCSEVEKKSVKTRHYNINKSSARL